ncbi:MAG: VWA domain-containing protein [Kiritimatiellae bacterium]|nr:VWA domain-containing protein [Kiritimatiellia bacterium]MDD5519583.1 VWA domain-containing protein [Kiritimatiellia bacterium]
MKRNKEVQVTEEVSVTADLARPSRICSKTKQRVIVIQDASPSMEQDGKKEAAHKAAVDMIERLAEPVNKNGFVVLVLQFNSKAEVLHNWTPATQFNGGMKEVRIASSTNITASLELALNRIQSADDEAEMTYLRHVTLIHSDGCNNIGSKEDVLQAADRLKKISDIVSVAFGDDADEDLLRKIASSPEHFYRCANGAELRRFMAQIGDTLTVMMAQQQNATQALTQLQR